MKPVIIPEPVSIEITDNARFFRVSSAMKVTAPEQALMAQDELLRFLSEIIEIHPIGGEQELRLTLCSEPMQSEAYRITVQETLITLCAATPQGLFLAVQTLKQLIFQYEKGIPLMEIYDCPLFESRGFMLDSGRYFFPKEDVLHFIDMMALHKLNELHWHLSEDQGFRLELECAPLLTLVGSVRSHTNFNTTPHEGFYTKKDVAEIISYAHSKYIRVIPEIDSPGHTVSMISAYPELSCFNRDIPVATHWGIKHDVLCPGKESTFTFMEKLLDELCEIFTDGVIHIGGDEVPATRWRLCPHCQKRMKEMNMTDEGELHIYYLERIACYLQKKGVQVRMWNDTRKSRTVNPEVCWQLWNDQLPDKDTIAEIDSGRDFILSCYDAYYLDLPYGKTSLKKAYEFSSVYSRLTPEQKKHIKGVEGCLWTEFVPDRKKAELMSLPRLAAVCENAWVEPEKKSYEQFSEKLDFYYSFLWAHGYSPALPRVCNPRPLRRLASRIYWERRQLCWSGISNLIDNLIVKIRYGKKK